jgi:hypothetical protein
MLKSICLVLILLMTSGCCELFGLCTSVNVHTSASSPDKFASSEFRGGEIELPLGGLQASREPGFRPVSIGS